MDDVVKVAQIAGPLSILLGGVIASIGIVINVLISRANKKADVIMHCINRYDEIYKHRISLLENTTNTVEGVAELYYKRLWGLRSDQFDFWLLGFVDHETLTSWFFSTLKGFIHNSTVCGVSFHVGWTSYGSPENREINTWFEDLVNDCKNISLAEESSNYSDKHLMELLLRHVRETCDATQQWRRRAVWGMISFAFYQKHFEQERNSWIRDQLGKYKIKE